MVDFNRYASTQSIVSDAGAPGEGRTTPVTISSVVCGETVAYTITATSAIGC